MDVTLELEYVGRIAAAALLGGVIGFERELHGQPAGLRTHMVVCIGAALITMVSLRIAGDRYDPGRVAAQVVTGIGFLGAGAILRFGTTVRGLTTAACLWTAAGIGLAVGLGWYVGAAAATLITALTVYLFEKVEHRMIGGKHLKKLTVKIRDHPGALGEIERVLERHKIFIKQVGIHKDVLERKAQVSILANCPDTSDFDQISRDLAALKDVETVDID